MKKVEFDGCACSEFEYAGFSGRAVPVYSRDEFWSLEGGKQISFRLKM